MNINLGTPYEIIIERIIEKGYGGNRTEIIRQALLMYERMIDEEEVKLVNTAINNEMNEIHEGKVKIKPLHEIQQKYQE